MYETLFFIPIIIWLWSFMALRHDLYIIRLYQFIIFNNSKYLRVNVTRVHTPNITKLKPARVTFIT